MPEMFSLLQTLHFASDQTMDVEHPEAGVSETAAAIAEPARTRMLCALLDGRARTSTELALIAGINPSTASVHLAKLRERRLVLMHVQGRHRYYSLHDHQVAAAIEALTVIAGGPIGKFEPNTPERMRAARTCYDHVAGALGVALRDRLRDMGWLSDVPGSQGLYDLTVEGTDELSKLGMDVSAARAQRRRFACDCLDWSERRPHLAGAVGAGLLSIALQRKWVVKDFESRVLSVTKLGQREMHRRFDLAV
jgi:DNA-binding transcriptional ArsR family regulator